MAATTVLAATGFIALSQAPSRDETHTLASSHHSNPVASTSSSRGQVDPSLGSDDQRTPRLYYAVTTFVRRAPGPDLVLLRGLSIGGWVLACIALAQVARQQAWRPAAVFVAGAAMTASGLVSQGMVARPYGLAVGALAWAVWAWQRSLRRPSARLALLLAASLMAAVSLHYAIVTVVPCFLFAEWLATRDRPERPRWVTVAIASGVIPVVVLAPTIHRAIRIVDEFPHQVGWQSLPSFYLSVGRPLLPAAVILLLLLPLATRVRRVVRPGVAQPRPAHGLTRSARTRRGALRDPFAALALLLAFAVPAQVVLITWATSGAYLHRYAIAGLVGLVLVLSGVTDLVSRSRPEVGPVIAVLVLASVPLAAIRAIDEQPRRSQVERLPAELGLSTAPIPVGVADSYVYSLLRSETAPSIAERVELVGPTTVAGDVPVFDIYQRSAGLRFAGPMFLVIDAGELPTVLRSAGLDLVRRTGRAQFEYGSTDRQLVGVIVRPSPTMGS